MRDRTTRGAVAVAIAAICGRRQPLDALAEALGLEADAVASALVKVHRDPSAFSVSRLTRSPCCARCSVARVGPKPA